MKNELRQNQEEGAIVIVYHSILDVPFHQDDCQPLFGLHSVRTIPALNQSMLVLCRESWMIMSLKTFSMAPKPLLICVLHSLDLLVILFNQMDHTACLSEDVFNIHGLLFLEELLSARLGDSQHIKGC